MKPESSFTKSYWTNSKGIKTGLHSRCNQCRNIGNQKTPSYVLFKRQVLLSHKEKPRLNLSKDEKRLRVNEFNRKWRKENPEKWSAINRLRRHKRRALGPINSTEWIAKVSILKNECQSCFKTEPEVKITIDHIIPVSKGGTNHIDNLQPLCMRCNQMKSNKLDWVSIFDVQPLI